MITKLKYYLPTAPTPSPPYLLWLCAMTDYCLTRFEECHFFFQSENPTGRAGHGKSWTKYSYDLQAPTLWGWHTYIFACARLILLTWPSKNALPCVHSSRLEAWAGWWLHHPRSVLGVRHTYPPEPRGALDTELAFAPLALWFLSQCDSSFN